MSPFPTDKLAWMRELYVGVPEAYETITIKVSEPWQESEFVWNCAVSAEHPNGKFEIWVWGEDAMAALGRALRVVRIRQQGFLAEYGNRLLWPVSMRPILGSSAEQAIIESSSPTW